ncbi:spike base protein, RCAP_Rcc01079 family [Rhodovulum visakhapatnamense]|uniref:Uncharacterized protein n=1 Tax=Rhodovulum visakhapatnamense TaxID=364297 RepID=A0A4R8FEF0_9RHOB|nr:hypothetical protein [Rhodovulum visakhapatnamense]TDX21875.1 hypothetical protein EV657_13511 [Rhodovulum visakhapatnamense]
MNDIFARHTGGLESPAAELTPISPSDSSDLTHASRALNVATTGFVRVTTVRGTTATVFIAAGIAFPVRVTRVWATGTTADGIVALL